MMYYKLVGEEVEPITGSLENQVIEWGKHFPSEDKFIARTTVGKHRKLLVSTVFLGLDHAFDGGPPLLFETMVFLDNGKPTDEAVLRCSTYQQAKEQHRAVVEKIEAGLHL